MNSIFKQRTITQIVASRQLKSRKKKQQIKIPSLQQQQSVTEHKVEFLTRKNNLNNQDKIILLRYIEKKYRVRFQSIFASNLTTWVTEREKKIIDKNYDSSKRSYYLLKGKISICQRGGGLRETKLKQERQQYEQISILQGEIGLGKIFDQQQVYHRCILVTQNAILLRIDHPQDELNQMQRNCLLTNQQRQNIVKKFILFKNLDNVNKHHTPYFQTKLFSRGQIVYNTGDIASHLYMIVQGQIEFQSKILIQNPEIQKQPCLAGLILKNSIQKYLTVGTQTITAGNFFGEEELLAATTRKQAAKCLSLTALLILVPSDRFQKLLYHQEFKDALNAAANDRKHQRKLTIQSLSNLHSHKKQSAIKQKQKSNAIQIDFNQFNEKICQNEEKFLLSTPKISLNDKRIKILHGNSIKVPPKFKTKSINFSMLEVNPDHYLKSMKKFRLFQKEQKKRQINLPQNVNLSDEKTNRSGCVRSLHQIWCVLKLQQVLQDQNEKMVLENKDGRAFYNAHMRLMKHIVDHKSYRPKTISSNSRVKTQYVQYLQNMI